MTKPRRHNISKAKKPTNKSFSSHPWECSFCKKNFNQTTQEHVDHKKICETKQKKIKAEQAMLAEKERRRAEELAAIKAKKEHARKSGWKKK